MNKLQQIQNKIIDLHSIQKQCDQLRAANKKIVFTNGCFDLIHMGHVTYLSQAADLGDSLVIGLNSDASVKRLKGDSRPLQSQEARLQVMASLFYVDCVVLFEEDTPQQLIEVVKPDFLVKGGDYQIEKIVGYDFVTSYGGRVQTLPFVDGCSSTSIIDKLG